MKKGELMPSVRPYNREAAVDYALKWDLKRNPKFLDFTNLGGDCTNFISQCLYAGSNVMNFTPVFGWYYNSANDRSPSWTGVQYLYNFLTTNTKKAVFAKDVPISQLMLGDVIQLGKANNHFYHSLLVTSIGSPPDYDNILISTHDYDAHYRPLNTYEYDKIRFLHIEGVYV